jgi:hypothetical protein
MYDAVSGNLLLGSGKRRSRRGIGQVLTATADGDESGEGVPAIDAIVFYPGDLAAGPDGAIYLVENGGEQDLVRVRYIQGGLIWTLAGGSVGFSGDGGPATEVRRRPLLSARTSAASGSDRTAAFTLPIPTIDVFGVSVRMASSRPLPETAARAAPVMEG